MRRWMNLALLLSILLGLFCLTVTEGDGKRLLIIILAFGVRDSSLQQILKNQRATCEAGWDVTFILLTTAIIDEAYLRYLREKLYCYNSGTSIPVIVEVHDKSLGLKLVYKHRSIVQREIDNYDVFAYLEDDMILDSSHVTAYLAETKKLEEEILKQSTIDAGYMIGFSRYQNQKITVPLDDTLNIKSLVYQKEVLVEIPFFKPVCFSGNPYFHLMGNTHQALWILTRSQILKLRDRCGFFDAESTIPENCKNITREYSSSLSLFVNSFCPATCALQKIVPAERFMAFTVRHYYPLKDKNFLQQTHPLFITEEHIQAGFAQFKEPLIEAGYYNNLSCFDTLIEKSRKEQNLHDTSKENASDKKNDDKTPKVVNTKYEYRNYFDNSTHLRGTGVLIQRNDQNRERNPIYYLDVDRSKR